MFASALTLLSTIATAQTVIATGGPVDEPAAVPATPQVQMRVVTNSDEFEGGLQWDWGRSHRYFIETKTQLPMMMWFAAKFNKQARVDWFDLRLVTECAPGVVETRRTWEVSCTIEDLALSAMGLPQEAGLLQPILDETDERLTGAVVQLQVRNDGRIVNIDLERLERRNRRFGQINENLRQVLSRAFAGLDLSLPEREADIGWVQNSGWIMRVPTAVGSSGNSELVHKIVSESGPVATIQSGGRALITPGDSANKFSTRMSGEATFDRRTGRLLDRTWTLMGHPTASSPIANGTEGYPYLQQGRVVSLSEGQTWDVGDSREIPANRDGQSAIQQTFFLGLRPR
ncbi:MAG: hypothetical protein KTR31_25020 [Myxococcales bacterium]|nr:hypothetical protein [Myxococcales bacterium]